MPVYKVKRYVTGDSGSITAVPFEQLNNAAEQLNSITENPAPASPIYDGDISNSSSDDYSHEELNNILDFNYKNVLRGIIFSEILGKPRARGGR